MSEHLFINQYFKESTLEDFYFFNVGHEICQPKHFFGPTVKENYMLHVIASGKGIYQINGITIPLTGPAFFLTPTKESIFYQADEQDPWEYYWLGFDGIKAAQLLQAAGFGEGEYTGQLVDVTTSKELFEKLLALDLYNPQSKFLAQSLFYQIFSQLIFRKSPIISSQTGGAFNRHYRDSFLLYVRNNYFRQELSIAEISRSLGLNRTYFSQLMKELLGHSPQEYLKEYRLEKAADFLRKTDLSVAEIAERVGYASSQSLSRAFKDFFGQSPRNFEK